jgi:hypothetical protein
MNVFEFEISPTTAIDSHLAAVVILSTKLGFFFNTDFYRPFSRYCFFDRLLRLC